MYFIFLNDLLTYFLTSTLSVENIIFKIDLTNHIIDIFILIEIRDTNLQKLSDSNDFFSESLLYIPVLFSGSHSLYMFVSLYK